MASKSKEPKEVLNKFLEGMKELSSEDQLTFRPFQDLLNSLYNPKNLQEKNKVLINIGIAAYMRNESTTAYHISEALKLGASEDEIFEAAMVSVIPGGIASMSFCVTYVKDAIKELTGKTK